MFTLTNKPDAIIRRSLRIAVLLAACGHLSAQPPAGEEDIRPPKPVVEIPQPEKPPVALWFGIGGGLLALALAVYFWRRHARRLTSKSPPEIALASLANLEANRESISAEAFANRAAQTVREYIANRFGLAAPRRTTEEFLRDVEKSPLLGESDHLRVFLKSCDLAKFAGSNLDSTQRGELLDAARGFVKATADNSKPQVTSP
jgi:hypothetical protein